MNNESINLFFLKRRKLVLGCALSVFVIIAAIAAFLVLQDVFNQKAISRLESFIEEYDSLKPWFDGENAENKDSVDDLLAALETFAGKTGGYAGARAWSMAGDMYAGKKAWQDAGNAYTRSAKKALKSYLAPVSYYNAAVCAEEAGDGALAREYWEKSLTYADFPHAARARFSIARVLESSGSVEDALAAYRLLVETYTKETEWVNLAQSRIIALENAAGPK